MSVFRPAWDSKNEKRAVKAVNKLKNVAKLIRLVKEALCLKARIAAVKTITDQKVLAYVAKTNKERDVCIMKKDILIRNLR